MSRAGGEKDSSRQEAVRELERIETGGAFAGLSRRRQSGSGLSEGKITDLVFGVTRWRRWLDFLIDSFYGGSRAELELPVRIILRIGIYELLLTHEPDYAVVSEAVESVRTLVGRRATGLVNGILRSVNRSRDALPEPTGVSEANSLGIRHSHPTWMVERWLARYGADGATRLLEYNNRRPHFGLRIRTGDRQGVLNKLLEFEADAHSGAEPSRWFEEFIRVDSLQGVFRSGLLSDGGTLVQDEAAGGVVRVLDPQPGERILDACAAPGGKSLFIADRVGKAGHVFAVDRKASRLKLLSGEAARLGFTQIETRAVDFTGLEPEESGNLYDRVLVDAPCSGLGVLAKRADLRWRMTRDRIGELQTLQAALMRAAARFVRPGGVLVYATCTTEPEENEAQAQSFLDEVADFEPMPVVSEVPGNFIGSDGFYVSRPHEHGIDGAFAARFRRRV